MTWLPYYVAHHMCSPPYSMAGNPSIVYNYFSCLSFPSLCAIWLFLGSPSIFYGCFCGNRYPTLYGFVFPAEIVTCCMIYGSFCMLYGSFCGKYPISYCPFCGDPYPILQIIWLCLFPVGIVTCSILYGSFGGK